MLGFITPVLAWRPDLGSTDMGIIDSLIGGVGSIIGSLTGIGQAAANGYNAASGSARFLTSHDGWVRIFQVFFGTLLLFGALKYGS